MQDVTENAHQEAVKLYWITSQALVQRRPLDVVDDQEVAHCLRGLQLEAKLFLNGAEDRRWQVVRERCCRRAIAGRTWGNCCRPAQVESVEAGQAGAILNGALDTPA